MRPSNRSAAAAGHGTTARLIPEENRDSDFKRVDEVCGLLAEKGTELGGPWSDHLEGPVWELRIRLRDVADRITY